MKLSARFRPHNNDYVDMRNFCHNQKLHSYDVKEEHIHTICRIAISRDFFEIFLPNPVLSVAVVDEVFTGFRMPRSGRCWAFLGSGTSRCPLEYTRLLPGASVSLPLETMGDDCLLGTTTAAGVSNFPFTTTAAPGRDLPAEIGLSGKVVLRFGGVSRGKSRGIIGCGGGRTRGLGELGLDVGAGLRPFERRPAEGEGLDAGDKEGNECRRVGVDGREGVRAAGELKFAGICGLELGVEGLELATDRGLSMEELVGTERVLEGVEGRDRDGREVGVEGLAVDGERVMGDDGLL